jgi:hypothetical protein
MTVKSSEDFIALISSEVPGALRWDVPGTMGKSSGTWELVIDPKTKTILHFLFARGK